MPKQPEQPQPSQEPGTKEPGKSKTNYTVVAIVGGAVALIVAIAIGVTLVLGSSNGPAKYIGWWHLVDSTIDGMDRDRVALAASEGEVVTLEIRDDRTAVYDYVLEQIDGKWGEDNPGIWLSFGSGNMNELSLIDNDSVLQVYSKGNKETYYFEKGKEYPVSVDAEGGTGGSDTIITDGLDTIITDGNDTIVTNDSNKGSNSSSNSASSSSSSASSSSSSSAKTDESTKSIGSQKVGSLTVPKLWYDRTSDLDPNIVDAYETVYFVDPDSVFSSTVSNGRVWAKSVEMTVQPTSYAEIANTTVQKYKGDTKTYDDVSVTDTELGGRKAKLISTSMPNDKNVQVRTLVVDRDGDGKVAVSLAFNAGYNETEAKEVLDKIASTWKVK